MDERAGRASLSLRRSRRVLDAGRRGCAPGSGPRRVVMTEDESVNRALARSIPDLGSLRIFDPDDPEHAVIAAGAPWFMTLFGRDSLITS